MQLGVKVTGEYEGVKFDGVLVSVDGRWLSVDTKPFARMGRSSDIRTGLAFTFEDIGRWNVKFGDEPVIPLVEDDQLSVSGCVGGFSLKKAWAARALAAL